MTKYKEHLKHQDILHLRSIKTPIVAKEPDATPKAEATKPKAKRSNVKKQGPDIAAEEPAESQIK